MKKWDQAPIGAEIWITSTGERPVEVTTDIWIDSTGERLVEVTYDIDKHAYYVEFGRFDVWGREMVAPEDLDDVIEILKLARERNKELRGKK